MSGMSLAGRTALVTGGGRGIGAACARRLAAHGAIVVVCGRSLGPLQQVAREIDGRAVQVDLEDRTAVDALVDSLVGSPSRVDILVNNAGLAESRTLEQTDDQLWDRLMELNVTAAFRLCRGLVPGMVSAGWGRVINLASNAGVSGYRFTVAYCATKHAMVGMTRAMAMDLAPTGVTVNAVCPGWVDTDLADRAVSNIADATGREPAAARAMLERMSPQNRLIQPDEVAHAVVSLCAEEARGIHGQAIVIDGGALMK